VVCILFMPIHYWTMMVMLFGTGAWTATIHDAVPKQMEPMMGAGYHTIHHEKFNYNYGQYLVLMDWIFGTLLPPTEADCDPALRAQEKGDISREELDMLRAGKAVVKDGKVVPLSGTALERKEGPLASGLTAQHRVVAVAAAGGGSSSDEGEQKEADDSSADEAEGPLGSATMRRRAGSRGAALRS